MMLINIGSGSAPTLTLDLDADDDGWLDTLPAGWSIVDSVGIIDGAATAGGDRLLIRGHHLARSRVPHAGSSPIWQHR